MKISRSISIIKDYRMWRSIAAKLNGGAISFVTDQKKPRGNVLLSYLIFPFLLRRNQFLGHSNRWECGEIIRLWLDRGYNVDVIDWKNHTWKPKKKYSYFIDIHDNIERLTPYLNNNCVKIFYGTTAYWQFQNNAEKARLADLKLRRGIELVPRRQISRASSYELADDRIVIGNDFTVSTYPNKDLDMTKIHVSTSSTLFLSINKDFAKVRKNFIWLGGTGCVHKGLDLVLETFVSMPEMHLTVCGAVEKEPDFQKEYHKELYETGNIRTIGSVDTDSVEFQKICHDSLGIIYPSCSEGTAGSVIISMLYGLVPVVSRETGVGVGDFGIKLEENSVKCITLCLGRLCEESSQTLNTRSLNARKYGETYHSRDNFSREWSEYIDRLLAYRQGLNVI